MKILIVLKESNSSILNNVYDMLMLKSLSSSLTFSVMNYIIIACKILNARSFSCWFSLSLFLFKMITCRNIWIINLNMLDMKTFWVIWTFTWASYSFDVCDVILKLSAFKLIAIVFNALIDSDETLIKLIMIIFNASIDSDETLIMKVSNFKMLVEMLFFNNLFTNLCSERMLNVCLQSHKFMFSLFSSLTNLTAWFLITQLKSETQK